MISVILPAYNEEKNISKMIKNIRDFFCLRDIDFEIVVVDDGSRDQTLAILQQEKKVVVVSHPKNLGYGSALRSGFAKAKGDLIFFTDSDCQFDIEDIKSFLPQIKEYDFVVGYRKNRQDPLLRKFYAFLFRLFAMIFFGVFAKDIDCAFKLFRADIIKKMNLVSGGALINLEIYAKAKKSGYKYIQLPVRHFERKAGRPTGGSFKVIRKAMAGFFKLWLEIKKQK